MRLFSFLTLSLLTLLTEARRDPRHVGKRFADVEEASSLPHRTPTFEPKFEHVKRAGKWIIPPNVNTTKYFVDGTKIPEVNFDIGESYAGLMPISSDPNGTSYYFWYFPTPNVAGSNDIVIWLNGGPGCSSLEGLLQENGPFLWQYGTFKPVKNPWTWVNLANTIWVEQPTGTGFTQGVPTETSEEQVGANFVGFWRNFIDTFALQGKNIYIAGESYAGLYVPYIADAMFNQTDEDYFNVKGSMIYDPSINNDGIMQEAPLLDYITYYDNLFTLNETFVANFRAKYDRCGYTNYLTDNLLYPPNGTLPDIPNVKNRNCNLWREVKNAVTLINPCFDIYQIATTCPLLYDVLGFPGSFEYLPPGASIYFNRQDVQQAINAPLQPWQECADIPLSNDRSEPSSWRVLPRVIEKSKRTIIGHGGLDFILMSKGSLLTIQNMTWNGRQGFQTRPNDDFYVPYHREIEVGAIAGAGIMGTTHTERGLTWVEIPLSGHMVPQYAPSAAFRMLEFLLGRVPNLSDRLPFTIQPDIDQPKTGGGSGGRSPPRQQRPDPQSDDPDSPNMRVVSGMGMGMEAGRMGEKEADEKIRNMMFKERVVY